jgi:hypothetical protein
MATQPTSIDDSFRAVTPEEIASYQKFGWVKLKDFIPRAKVDELLAMAKDRMGENGDRDLPPEAFTYFNPLTLRGLKHPLMGPIIEHCGRSARALMARRARVGIRYFTDFFAVKQPAKKKQAGRGGAGGSDWHQDYAASALGQIRRHGILDGVDRHAARKRHDGVSQRIAPLWRDGALCHLWRRESAR